MYKLKKKLESYLRVIVGTRPSSYEKIIYRDAFSQSLRNTALNNRALLSHIAV